MMAHIVYVDLSAKAEQWQRDSAIAVSNGVGWTCLVSSDVKVQMRDWLLDRYGYKNIQYRALAVLVCVAVRSRLAQIDYLILDRDYTGKQVEATIKNMLLPLLRLTDRTIHAGFIRFANVKNQRADIWAKEVYDRVRQPDRVVSWAEVQRLLGQ